MTAPTSRPLRRPLWIGTYPAPGAAAGSGEGIWYADVDLVDGTIRADLSAMLGTPSFLALHPSGTTLYSVSEGAAGSITAFAVEQDDEQDASTPTLAVSGSVTSGGSAPCHVLALEDAVWLANYSDGVASVLPVDPTTGALGADGPTTFPGSGTGPVVDRQEGPHAHFVTLAGDEVLVVDLGADVLRRYPRTGGPGGVAATLPPGTGPRHLVVLGDGSLVVAGELDARLHVLAADGDGWVPVSSVPVSAGATAGVDFAAHVTLSADGTRVHVGVRGSDVLAVHRLIGTGGTPTLEHLADVPLGDGAWPRHHAVLTPAAGAGTTAEQDDTELVVVALQGTSELVTVRVDRASGAGHVVARHTMPTPPACVLEA